jgi:methionine biosynthesis protein MetW
MNGMDDNSRPDLAIIADWIAPGSRVLDLGCGDGTLLSQLSRTRGVSGYGLERDDAYIPVCIARGLNVIQCDLNRGLSDFDNDSFDYVVLSLTLPGVRDPAPLLGEILRVGRQGVVTFPNLGHWRARLRLAFGGRMPGIPGLTDAWHVAPNRHLCTQKDFEDLCRDRNIRILERRAVDRRHQTSAGLRLLPNLLGEIALYRFTKLLS